jgi:hypothetical protein
LIFSDLENDFTHGLVTFKILVRFNNILPVEDLVNVQLEDTIILGKVLENSVIVNGTA